ncbi:hypothetical protein INR75_02530 [Zunongwangia sp. SCSIO 43204]|uniref:hypothetical protein n=1 Tax=Zunongwangia sp. SCSIO 43204 TaxID=2779359 RepID=UPI001CA8EA35|nr:hypothetical protein [Zunongwangia sp. SCSIO 43204]UAB84926.1 hypothetical protein INR75_02530 [Zunongwangia sp. SCSIO 43204]
MKHILFILIFISGYCVSAQEYKLGLTLGVNYPWQKNNGDLTNSQFGGFTPSPLVGYQGGLFYERGFSRFLLRPQINYYRSRGEYEFPNSNPIYILEKVNFELLFGFKIFENLAIIAGPAYQTIIRNEFDLRGEDLRDNMRKANIVSGFKLKLSRKLEVSLLYDWTFDSDGNQNAIIPYNGSDELFLMDDARINMLNFNLHYALFTNQSGNKRAKSGSRGCYF